MPCSARFDVIGSTRAATARASLAARTSALTCVPPRSSWPLAVGSSLGGVGRVVLEQMPELIPSFGGPEQVGGDRRVEARGRPARCPGRATSASATWCRVHGKRTVRRAAATSSSVRCSAGIHSTSALSGAVTTASRRRVSVPAPRRRRPRAKPPGNRPGRRPTPRRLAHPQLGVQLTAVGGGHDGRRRAERLGEPRASNVRNSRKSNNRLTSAWFGRITRSSGSSRRASRRSTLTSRFLRTRASDSAGQLPRLRGQLVEVGEDPVEPAVGRDQLGRGLLADSGHTGQVVAGIATQGGVLGVLRRGDAVRSKIPASSYSE